MEIYIIAQVVSGNKVVGYRLLDVDSKEEPKIYSVDNIKKVLSNSGNKSIITNAALVAGEVVGTNGKLDRYPKIDSTGRLITGNKSPLIVVSKIEDIGYNVVDFSGRKAKLSNADAVKYAKEFGIANGKVNIRDSVEFISSITDNYKEVKLNTNKAANVNVNIPIHISGSMKSVAKHTENDIETEMQYNDVFSALSVDQRRVVKQYYTWYTVNVYKGLANNLRLDIAPEKVEKLAQLRGIDKWQFAGINDTHLEGRFDAKCELGHNLRYEFYAIPEEDANEAEIKNKDWQNNNYGYKRNMAGRKDLEKMKYSRAIVFGETCAGDFFNISKEDMKKLVKTRRIMSEEITLIADIVTNNKTEYNDKCRLLYDMIYEINNQDKIVSIFGEVIGNTMLAFIEVAIPLPMSLVLLAADGARKNSLEFIENITGNDSALVIRSITESEDDKKFYTAIKMLFKYVLEYSIEGDYQYDPVNDNERIRRDVGAYNKETRDSRARLNKRLRGATALNLPITMDKIKSYLKIINRLDSLGDKVVSKLDKSAAISEYFNGDSYYRSKNAVHREILNMAQSRTKVSDDADIKYFTVLASALYNFKKYSYGQAFAVRITSYEGRYRSTYSIRNIDELGSIIEDCESDEKIIEKALDKFIADIDDMCTGYYFVELASNSKHYEELKDRYCIVIESGQIKKEFESIVSIPGGSSSEMSIKVNQTYSVSTNDIVRYERVTLTDVEEAININKEREEKRAEKQKSKSEETANKVVEKTDRLEMLRELLKGDDINKEDYGVKVAESICEKEEKYEDLTPKQKWRVDDTLSRFGGEEIKEKLGLHENIKSKLEDGSELALKIEKLIEIGESTDEKLIVDIEKATEIAFSVAKSIKKKGEFSSKQLKHINLAFDVIDNK